MDKRRLAIQAVATLLQNAQFKGFFTGTIYQGAAKGVCVPGLNCYACPGALGACPLGSLQHFLGSRPVRLPYYVVGMVLFFGALLGRAVCGFLCPMGLLQDLLHRIPTKKVRTFRGDKWLRYFKYVLLAALVLLPLFVALTPFFCKYICPAGTLAGITLALGNGEIRALLGGLFTWKSALLGGIVLLSVVLFRPFCKYLCPLGAIYGLCNPIALYRGRLDAAQCTHCGACSRACPMQVPLPQGCNSTECIRCGACARACPTGALRMGFAAGKEAPHGR